MCEQVAVHCKTSARGYGNRRVSANSTPTALEFYTRRRIARSKQAIRVLQQLQSTGSWEKIRSWFESLTTKRVVAC